MDFDLTRFGLISSTNAGNIQRKTDLTKTKKSEETEEKNPVVQTKTADASALDAAAAQNLGFVRSAGAKKISGEDVSDLAGLYALAGINFRMPTEKEYTRISTSARDAMRDIEAVGVAANAEKALADFEKYFG
ncbi:hypothetical protein J6E39_09275 [bacterium]|nr:hypothetical protein [bacterium]